MPYPELFILRHGETEWNVERRLQGRLDSPLTQAGLAQAESQRRILAPILTPDMAIRVSPTSRCLTTAQIALGPAFARAVKDARLVEVGLGAWQGRSLDEVRIAHPDRTDIEAGQLWKFGAPGGETLAQMVDRCAAVLAQVRRPTILVTHGVTSRVLRCLALSRDPTGIDAFPDAQGVVYHVKDGATACLSAE